MSGRTRQAGQVLPITAIFLVALLGLAALVLDIGGAYAEERKLRAVADASSLAGGQDLVVPGSRAMPGTSERERARKHAMKVLVDQLNATSTPTGGNCFNSTGCVLPGTPYTVSIQTPSPSCVDCTPGRAVQVTITNSTYQLLFAPVLTLIGGGIDTYTVRVSSVAGVLHGRQYGVVTLRPPRPRANLSDANEDNLVVTGGSKVIAREADVITNTNAVCSGFASGSAIVIDLNLGFDLHHFAPYKAWLSGSGRCAAPVPPGEEMTSPVDLPAYVYPSRTGAPTFNSEAEASFSTTDPDPLIAEACREEQRKVTAQYRELKTDKQMNVPYDPLLAPDGVNVTCYKPGIYRYMLDIKDAAAGPPTVAMLLPGVYFFDAGVRVTSSFIGGYEPGKPGVALIFKEAKNSNGNVPGQFTTATSTSLVVLNFASEYCPGPPGTTCLGGATANPARDFQGNDVATPAPNPQLLTVMVEWDPACTVGIVAPPGCNESNNKTLTLTGGGTIFLAGVQYAPSDNATLTGNSGQRSEIGAFWSWTVSFNGGTQFNLAGRDVEMTGVLRLDPACSPTVSVCNQ